MKYHVAIKYKCKTLLVYRYLFHCIAIFFIDFPLLLYSKLFQHKLNFLDVKFSNFLYIITLVNTRKNLEFENKSFYEAFCLFDIYFKNIVHGKCAQSEFSLELNMCKSLAPLIKAFTSK